MGVQAEKGKAFEYACLKALEISLSKNQAVVAEATAAFEVAKEFYEKQDNTTAGKMDRAAMAAAKVIARMEPILENPDDAEPLYLSIQEDAKGQKGDVRDVVCVRKQNKWEIGLSCKHNHSAVKHSRLSQTIDFGEIWFGKPCSEKYFTSISPIFIRLIEYRKRAAVWNEMTDKVDSVYKPLLDAFIEELRRLDEAYPEEIPMELVRYLLGRNDFYKVIAMDSKKITKIQAYNLFGTLNKPSKKVKPLHTVHQLALPTKFYDISYKKNSDNTIIVTCDGGWAFSFRIHNASTKVEPSLKFDVQICGMPPELHTQVEPWEE